MKDKENDPNPHLILPVGTQVVTRVEVRGGDGQVIHPQGAVGRIVKVPSDHWHTYRVGFPDQEEASFKRRELMVRKRQHSQNLFEASEILADYDLDRYVVYRCITGSRAYGLDRRDSDLDRRGIYLPPADLHWSLFGLPEQLENREKEECYWEMQKFLTLALKGNPNILECLYTPLVEYAAPLVEELLEIRDIFLSRLIYQTYNGYAMSQFKKMEQDLRARGQIRWKHAMHLIRLLLSGIKALEDKTIPVDMTANRERLLAVRDGLLNWREVNSWRLELHREFDRAYQKTDLPERPDYEAANAFLLKARRSMVGSADPSVGVDFR